MSKKFKTATKEQRQTNAKMRTSKSPSFIKNTIKLEEWKPNDGENAIRIVPPLATEKHGDNIGLDVRVFFMNATAFIQPNTFDKTLDEPLYKEFRKRKAKNAPESILKQLRGTARTLMFVIDPEDKNSTVKYWLAPKSVVDGILGIAKNRRTGEYAPIEDPVKGRVVFFEKTGSGLLTKYSGFSLDAEAMPLDDKVADQLVHFDDLLSVPTVEECQEHIEMLDLTPDEEDDDEHEVFEGSSSLPEVESDEPDVEEPVDEPVKEEEKPRSLKERMAERKRKIMADRADPSVTV